MKNELHTWMLTEKLVDDYPMAELEDFLSVTDYSKTLSADYYEEWMAEGWIRTVGELRGSGKERGYSELRGDDYYDAEGDAGNRCKFNLLS